MPLIVLDRIHALYRRHIRSNREHISRTYFFFLCYTVGVMNYKTSDYDVTVLYRKMFVPTFDYLPMTVTMILYMTIV